MVSRSQILALSLLLASSCKHDDDAKPESAEGAELQSSVLAGAPTATGGNVGLSMNSLLAHSGMPHVRFLPVPLVQESQDFSGGAAALRSLLMFWGDDLNEGTLVRLLKTDPHSGTSYHDVMQMLTAMNDPQKRKQMLAFADNTGATPKGVPASPPAVAPETFTIDLHAGLAKKTRKLSESNEANVPTDGMTTGELEAAIEAGHPVLVMLQAWGKPGGAANSTGYKDDSGHGHFVVAMGYDRTNFFFMDPATTGNYTYIPKNKLAERWHDVDTHQEGGKTVSETVRHFGLIFYRSKPAWDFDAITMLE
jgi:predicted double-glycine peptidase